MIVVYLRGAPRSVGQLRLVHRGGMPPRKWKPAGAERRWTFLTFRQIRILMWFDATATAPATTTTTANVA